MKKKITPDEFMYQCNGNILEMFQTGFDISNIDDSIPAFNTYISRAKVLYEMLKQQLTLARSRVPERDPFYVSSIYFPEDEHFTDENTSDESE